MSSRLAASFVVIALAFPSIGRGQSVQQTTGNAVVGVVVDVDHKPVPRAQVQAFSAEDVRNPSNRSQLLTRNTGSASTDETGMFRISGLPAGEYVVAADAFPRFPGGGPLPARVYGPAFDPSTLDLSRAVFVSAIPDPAGTIEINLVPVEPVRVSGTVVSAAGRSTEGLMSGCFDASAASEADRLPAMRAQSRRSSLRSTTTIPSTASW